MSDLADRLETKAALIEMGEKIAWGSEVALMREAAVALRACKGRVKVKPLVWRESIEGASYFASPCVGEYRVTKTRNAGNDKWQVTYLDPCRRSHTIGYIDGFEAAKAAAQADYEARILAAIEQEPRHE